MFLITGVTPLQLERGALHRNKIYSKFKTTYMVEKVLEICNFCTIDYFALEPPISQEPHEQYWCDSRKRQFWASGLKGLLFNLQRSSHCLFEANPVSKLCQTQKLNSLFLAATMYASCILYYIIVWLKRKRRETIDWVKKHNYILGLRGALS